MFLKNVILKIMSYLILKKNQKAKLKCFVIVSYHRSSSHQYVKNIASS